MSQTNRNGELIQQYTSLIPKYKRMLHEVKFILKSRLERDGIRIQYPIQARIKKFESFCEKVDRKKISGNPFDSIYDLAALRVICLYRSDLEKIGKLIHDAFELQSVDEKILNLPIDEFGYMSNHYVIRLPDTYSGARYDDIRGICCEIQVRTVLMHAWAAVSHDLQYKKDVDIPPSLKRDFYALSGLLHLADSQFELFRSSQTTLRSNLVDKRLGRFDRDQNINLDTLFAFLRWKVPDRKTCRARDYSDLVTDLQEAGYRKILALDRTLDASLAKLVEYESKYPPVGSEKYTDVGAVRIALAIQDPSFAKLAHADTADIVAFRNRLSNS